MNFIYLALFAAAFIAIQCMIGGTRLLFSLPSYGVLSVAALLTLITIRRKKTQPDFFCLLATLVMAAYVLARSHFSPIEYLARPDFFMMMGCVMAYLLSAYYITSTRDRLIFVVVLWLITMLELYVGIRQFKEGNNYMLFGFIRNDPTNALRASGMFISPNHFAGYLETVGIISISIAIWSRWRLEAKVIAGFIAGLSWMGVAISGSRGGYLSTLFSLLVFAGASLYTVRIVEPRKFVPAAIGLGIGIGVLVAVAAFLMLHSELITERLRRIGTATKDVRVYNWQAALDQFRLQPWLGTGAGTHLYFGRLFRRPQIQADPVHAHSDYLELLAEYGIAGACLMTLFLFAHLRNGLRAFSFLVRKRLLFSGFARSDTFALQVGALCAVAALAAHSVVDFNMHIPGNALLFAFIFGMLANPGFEPEESGRSARLTPWFQLVLPALGAWMLYAGLRLLPAEFHVEQSRVALRNHEFARSIEHAKKALGEGSPSPNWFERTLSRLGPDLKNPFLYFYIGEANRGLALNTRYTARAVRTAYYRNAVEAYGKGLAIFPQDENLLVRLAQVFDALRVYDGAEEAYQKALKADPNLGEIYIFYGNHLKLIGKNQEAEEAYQKGRELGAKAIPMAGPSELTQ